MFAKYTKHLVLDGVTDPLPDAEEKGVLFAKGITATWNGVTQGRALDSDHGAAGQRSSFVGAAFIMQLLQPQ